MKSFRRAVALALLVPLLGGCALGSPYRVETRDPVAAPTQQKTYEQLLWERKRAERSQGAQGEI